MKDTCIVHPREAREQTSLSPTVPNALKALMKLVWTEGMNDEN